MTAKRRTISSSLSQHDPGKTVIGDLNENKHTLPTGDAVALGIMVFYNWREKRLARNDPESYARLQRLKALFRDDRPDTTREKKTGVPALHPSPYRNNRHKTLGTGMSR